MGKIHDHNILVGEQISYYQARAHEYDEWFFRQGRYDRGDELNEQWFSEVKQVRQAVDAFGPTGMSWRSLVGLDYGQNSLCNTLGKSRQ